MKTIIKPSNKKTNQVVCFIDGTLGVFENVVDHDCLLRNCVNKEAEVYIIEAVAVKDGKASMYRMGVVRPGDMLVEAHALECSGSMCSTNTSAMIKDKFTMIYPGKCGIYVADNVNAKFYHLPYYPCPNMPMWVRKYNGKHYVIGADRVEDMDWHMRTYNKNVVRVKDIYDARNKFIASALPVREYPQYLISNGYASSVKDTGLGWDINWIL